MCYIYFYFYFDQVKFSFSSNIKGKILIDLIVNYFNSFSQLYLDTIISVLSRNKILVKMAFYLSL